MPPPISFDKTSSENMRQIMGLTERKWLNLWFENAAVNMPMVRDGLDINAIPKRPGAAVIVGGGPSIYRYRHLETLAKYRHRIPTIITTDKMLKPLIVNTCRPDFVASIDGDPIVSEYFQLHSDERHEKVDSVFNAVTTHPLTVKTAMENLDGKVYWYMHFFDDPTENRIHNYECPKCGDKAEIACGRLSITAALHYMSHGKTIIQAAGNIGAFAWHFAYYLGADPIIMVGMDYSYLKTTPLEKTEYYNGYMRMCNKDMDKVRLCYQLRENPDFHNRYLADLMFDAYRDMLTPFIQRAKTRTVNATGGGALHGRGITGVPLEKALEKWTK